MSGTTIIFSDTHLMDRFDPNKFTYLYKIISQADKIIINGDFWDGSTSFDAFVESGWKALFPLLRSKEAIYIYGNHDPEDQCDERAARFSVLQLDELDIEISGIKLHIEHGGRLARHKLSIIMRIASWTVAGKPIGGHLLYFLAKLGLRLFGRMGLIIKEKSNNERMKVWAREMLEEDQILICGHTHLAELDLDAQLVNSGFIDFGYGQYLKIEDGNLTLVDERY